MFQPTNASYIHNVVQATIDRHHGETEEERAIRQGLLYRPSSAPHPGRRLLISLGYLLLDLGKRLESVNAQVVSPQRQTNTEISPS